MNEIDKYGIDETRVEHDRPLSGDDILALVLEAHEEKYPFLLVISKPTGDGKANSLLLPSPGTSMKKWAEVVADAAELEGQ